MPVLARPAPPEGHDDLVIDFSAGGNSQQFRTTGWSDPEPDEVWAVGAESRLLIPAPRRPSTYVVVMSLRPLVAEGRLSSQRLVVVVNDVTLDTFTVDQRTVRTCLVPWTVIDGKPALDIRFRTPDAARPSDLGLNDDRRVLAMAFTSVVIYPDKYEAWQVDGFLSGHDPVPVDPASVTAAERLPLPDLMMQFESLGQNCEFGLVQRRCQAEPLGLLRFSSTPLPKLLAALNARFEGMGSPGNTTVQLSSNGREFMVHDTRYGFLYHAWVNAGEMSAADVLRREVRRVPFLVRKLIEDLEAGDKTFVFKGMGAMPEEEVFPLAMAIRRYGPNTLLFVNLADADHPGGTVEARGPGFRVGYLDRFAPGDNAHDLLLGQWIKVCRETYRMRLTVDAATAT